jgi:imidazolonepropionase
MTLMRLLLRNATQVIQVVAKRQPFLKGTFACNTIDVIHNGSLLIDREGNIAAVGTVAEVDDIIAKHDWSIERIIDCTGKVLLPGFVDAHTHPVWSGDRSHEFVLKLAGASYLQVQQAGGGIGFTTRCTRETSEDELLALLLRRMDRMMRSGTTTLEGKSGYGLERDTELKMLRVLHRANAAHPLSVVSTFCGAHAVPAGTSSQEAMRDVIDCQLPAVLKEREEGKNSVVAIDVFCETGVFSHEESREILAAGRAAGLRLNFHGDELSCTHSGELAGSLEAHAVAHLEHVTPEGIAAMAAVDCFAVLLPSTAYVLRIQPPPARTLIDGNVPVALGSDFCPNAHMMSMPHTMNLACVLMHMTVEEALVASTINSAASLGLSDVCGSLETGKWGDVVVLDTTKWEHIVYEMVDPPIAMVVKRGVVVSEKRT